MYGYEYGEEDYGAQQEEKVEAPQPNVEAQQIKKEEGYDALAEPAAAPESNEIPAEPEAPSDQPDEKVEPEAKVEESAQPGES